MTLLCRVKWFGGHSGGWVMLLEGAEYLAGDDPLEASFGLPEGLAFGESASDVGAGGGVGAAAGQRDRVQGPVELAVAAPVEAMAIGQPGGGGDRGGAGEGGERGLRAQPTAV
jgi:hypothetical protein